MKRPPSPLSQQKKTWPHFIFSRVYLSKYSNSALVIGPLCCSCCCTYSKFKFFDTSGITRARTVLCSTCFCLLRDCRRYEKTRPNKTLKPFVRWFNLIFSIGLISVLLLLLLNSLASWLRKVSNTHALTHSRTNNRLSFLQLCFARLTRCPSTVFNSFVCSISKFVSSELLRGQPLKIQPTSIVHKQRNRIDRKLVLSVVLESS